MQPLYIFGTRPLGVADPESVSHCTIGAAPREHPGTRSFVACDWHHQAEGIVLGQRLQAA